MNYLTFIRKSDFTDLFKFGYLFIDSKAVVEFDGAIGNLQGNMAIQNKILERVNQFDYSFTVLLVHFNSEHIEDGKIYIQEVQHIFALDEKAKKEIEISYDSRIRIDDPIWPGMIDKLQECFLYEDTKKGVHNIWNILKINQPITDVNHILPDSELKEVVTEVYKDNRPQGPLSFWVYLLRYERHGYFPKYTLGYMMDLVSVFINTMSRREQPSEAIEGTDIYKALLRYNDPNLKLKDLIYKLSENPAGNNFFNRVNEITGNMINAVTVALLFLVFKETFTDGFSLSGKSTHVIEYAQEHFPKEVNYSLYLLGIYLGNNHTFECLYDSLPLPIFKKKQPISFNTNGAKKDNSQFAQRVYAIFNNTIASKSTKASKDILSKGLRETLQIIEDHAIIDQKYLGYFFITALDNKPEWNRKKGLEVWEKMQQAICPDYEQIRTGKFSSADPSIPPTDFTNRVRKFYSGLKRVSKELDNGLNNTLSILDRYTQIDEEYIGYFFITALDNTPNWDKSKKRKAWDDLQKQFCPSYYSIIKGDNMPVDVDVVQTNNNNDLRQYHSDTDDDDIPLNTEEDNIFNVS